MLCEQQGREFKLGEMPTGEADAELEIDGSRAAISVPAYASKHLVPV